jgi:sugar phosphate isomerase/epimerase
MKFSFSNIAWDQKNAEEIFALLKQHKISGIEVAPSKIWPNWQGANYKSAISYKNEVSQKGFVIPALQAILFNKPEAKLFDSEGEKNLVEHLKLVAEISEGLGAKCVVFGAPKQRNIGSLTHDEALDHSIGIFRKIGDIFANHNVAFCIEPNPKKYSCNFINNIDQGNELVKKVNHKNFALHLDAAGMFLENDNLAQKWSEISDIVHHFHVSEPDLGDFDSPQVNHLENFRILEQGGYKGWCSVEMLEPKKTLSESGVWKIINNNRITV